MKILFLSDDFPPLVFGGAGQVAYNLAHGFQKAGHQIFVIATCREKSQEGEIEHQGLKIFRIFANYHPRWQAYLSIYNPQTAGRVRELIKEIKPDIVHFHNINYYLSYYCFKLAKKYSQALFLTAHDAMLVYYGKWGIQHPKDLKITIFDQIREAGRWYNPFRNIVIRYFLKYVDKIFTVSSSLKKLLEINGIKNIETIHNGIDIENWRPEAESTEKFKKQYNLAEKKIILFGGRLSTLKGGKQIIRVVARIKERIPEIILLVAGKKQGYVREMDKLVKELGIKENVIFTGWLSGEELKTAFFSSDIVVTPSIYLDPFPTVNLEAMACKKPVVGTCFGGTSELVLDKITGYIVDPRNIDDLAEKIIDLLKNPQKAREFGEAGFERVKKEFSIEQQVTKTIEWYQRFL